MEASNEMFRDEIAEAKKNLTDVLDAYCDKWEVSIKYRLPKDGDTETNSKHERRPK